MEPAPLNRQSQNVTSSLYRKELDSVLAPMKDRWSRRGGGHVT